jgi:beta-lactamase regulating signal transducer with metallopeptidase domain
MDRCQDHDKLSEAVIRMEEKLDAAIKEVTGHITAGSRWRLAIVVACIGLVGSIVGAIVRFSVMEYRVSNLQNNQEKMLVQIYDLNYEKGRAVGLAE